MTRSDKKPPVGMIDGKPVHCLGCDLAYVPNINGEGPAWVQFNGGIEGYDHTSRIHDNPLCKLSYILKSTETGPDDDKLGASIAEAVNEDLFGYLMTYELNKEL